MHLIVWTRGNAGNQFADFRWFRSKVRLLVFRGFRSERNSRKPICGLWPVLLKSPFIGFSWFSFGKKQQETNLRTLACFAQKSVYWFLLHAHTTCRSIDKGGRFTNHPPIRNHTPRESCGREYLGNRGYAESEGVSSKPAWTVKPAQPPHKAKRS